MKYYFAPLEGITGYLYRGIHHKHYPGLDRYYAPFVVTRDGGIMKKKELRDILPENNPGITLIPQILTNDADNFLRASESMYALGYDQVNLNLGCPSGTVTGKGRGSGFLKWENRHKLEAFLEKIFRETQGKISIKTRIGWDDPEEFTKILELYRQFPICELIIHPRTRTEMYQPGVHRECFDEAYEQMDCPLCYNGDLATSEDVVQIGERYPDLPAVMIGRGLLADPAMVARMQGRDCSKDRLWDFYQDIFRAYQQELSGDTHLLQKMKELWIFMAPQFCEYEKYLKKIKKSHKLAEYEVVVAQLFEQPLITE